MFDSLSDNELIQLRNLLQKVSYDKRSDKESFEVVSKMWNLVYSEIIGRIPDEVQNIKIHKKVIKKPIISK